ncbi:MAG: translation initiation factor IF-2 [Elusimicrobia bacterium]|nr:translation initiation factor IF-2 [Elusimicrobiota bacterium]
MEKEKKKDSTKKTAAKKPAAEKKAAAKKHAEKVSKPKTALKKDRKKGTGLVISRAQAAVRTAQEENSIAPPSTQLVDAFAKYRKLPHRPAVNAPAVARVAPGGSPPPRPETKPPEAPKDAAPSAPKSPAAAAPPTAPARPATKAMPEPTATYKLDAPAALRPAVLPAVKAAPPAAKPPAAAPAKAPPPSSTAPRPAAPGAVPKPAPGAKASAAAPAALPAKAPPRPAGPAARPAPAKPAQGAKPAAPGPRAPAAKPPAPPKEEKPPLKPLQVSTLVTVRELAEKMGLKVNDLIKKMIGQGVFATINQRLDSETAILIAADYGFDLEVKPLHMEAEITAAAAAVVEKPEDIKPRAPVVTIMGHVDHGKTSLLDAIRKSDVVAGESGGITQHIGAYKVTTPKGDIVFLDTPGHEAFTAMRSRGSKVTDIVVLVVSAADGVMPQTIEAMDHAKAAGVPIVVAVNKIDLPGANPQKIRQELSQHGLPPEEWGGKTIFVDISAKKRLNLEKLLEMLLLQAELLELKANPTRAAQGAVIEAKMDTKRGFVATVLIQNGTVKVGDPFVMGLCSGKVKALVTDRGERITSAGPATPVEILGISGGAPQAGDAFNVVKDDAMAREIALKRNRIQREEALAHKQHLSLLGLKSSKAKQLPIILKADVQGSIEALKDQIEKISTSEISVRVIHSGLGNANESDILLAGASDAVVLLFHVDVEPRAKEVAQLQGVEVRRYEIIYDLSADVKAALEGLLEPEIVDVVVGKAEVRALFSIRGSKIAGCFVLEGKLVRGASVRVLRGGAALAEAKIESLKRFKDDAKEVEKSLECGVGLGTFGDAQPGDIIEAFVKEKRIRRLESSS